MATNTPLSVPDTLWFLDVWDSFHRDGAMEVCYAADPFSEYPCLLDEIPVDSLRKLALTDIVRKR